jgi:uncharacterized iron-regulated membrane protein
MGRRQFAFHRWLTLLVSVQLFLWSLGGLIFATHDIDWVRGEEGRRQVDTSLDLSSLLLTPADAKSKSGFSTPIDALELRNLQGRTVYEVRSSGRVVVVDGVNGELLTPIDESTAVEIALHDRTGEPNVLSVSLVESDPPVEYRGRPLPAWRVRLADGEGTHIYVVAESGRVGARRNDAWRRFDFFWMLHTMDYGGRDNFNHLLLIAFASLGLMAVLSGWLLWAVRFRGRLKRRRKGQAAHQQAAPDRG